MNVAELLDLTVWKRFLLFALLVFSALNRASALVVDDAMTLSVRVPHQLYVFTPEAGGYLRKDNAEWLIPLEACDPATLTIHTTNLKYAPYAVRIVTSHRQPSWEMSHRSPPGRDPSACDVERRRGPNAQSTDLGNRRYAAVP